MASQAQVVPERLVRQGAHVAEMQRRRLLLALGEVVGEGGLEAANVGRICARAGVSRRTFYELFTDREACLLAALDQAVERIAQRVAPAYAGATGKAENGASKGAGGWQERTRAALCVLLEYFEREPNVARLCVVEAPRAGPEVLERRRALLEVLAAALEEGRGGVRPGSEPPPLTAQGIVGGALAVIHERLSEQSAPGGSTRSLVELAGPLMGMIVHPYLGPAAARRELERPVPATPRKQPRDGNGADPFKGLPIRFTYRTARVLSTIATHPEASNRYVAEHAGITDEGQTSRLLHRLRDCGLIENHGQGHGKGEPNAWTLTQRGHAIHTTIKITP